jgi:hypothetical protein
MIPELHAFANPRLRRFQASENRELPVPEKHASRTLSNPDVSRVTGFPEFPNTWHATSAKVVKLHPKRNIDGVKIFATVRVTIREWLTVIIVKS